MTSRARRAIALPASVVALAIAALATQALIAAPAKSAAARQPAGGTSGWRVDKTISVHDKSVILVSLDAVNAKDAWVAGMVVSKFGSPRGPMLEHWDGTAWRRVALPAKPAQRLSGHDVVGFVGASSASNVWEFSLKGKYLRLVGGHWAFGRLPASSTGRTFVESVKVFSRTDVWVFGAKATGAVSNLRFTPYAAQFNGRRWTVISVPGKGPLGPVSAINPRDMWAITDGEAFFIGGAPARASIVHWNGVAWHNVTPQPNLPRQTILSGILARTNRDVWVGGGTEQSDGSAERAWHWNGTAWTSRSPRASADGQQYLLASLVPAPGGMWALGQNLGGLSRVWRYSGSWSAPVRLPWDLFQLAAVPHTDSIWAIGENAAMDNGVIVLHGPAPR
ncbi:MAG TPA: hypothetical protein VEV63_19205 [Streptosporangiaceae bacterium]|nr:hypothetical protein [Streptosporangiaceae bacterium]